MLSFGDAGYGIETVNCPDELVNVHFLVSYVVL
jgi:hypothetical protein